MLIDDLIHVSSYQGDIILENNLKIATRFQVDNVASYVYDIAEQWKRRTVNGILFLHEIIPNVAPLAPIMWFEYQGICTGNDSNLKMGCLVKTDGDFAKELWPDYVKRGPVPHGLRWVLGMEHFYIRYLPDSMQVKPCATVYSIGVYEDGRPAAMNHLHNSHIDKWDNCDDDDLSAIPIEEVGVAPEVIIALTSICFAHCKGTEMKEHQPSRQVRRQAERKGTSVYTHRTIDIGPASQVLREEGNVSQNGLGKALHVCRGHFANYTADKPLFGKYVGTVYKPMHIRGKSDNGVVEKDYKVHA